MSVEVFIKPTMPKSVYASRNRNSGGLRSLKFKLSRHFNRMCFYCGVKTLMSKAGAVKISDNSATVDHTYWKWDMRRRLSNETVLCCWKCNKEKWAKDEENFYSGYDYRLTFDLIKYFQLQYQ